MVSRVAPVTPPAKAVTLKFCSTAPAGMRSVETATPFSEPNGLVTSDKGLTWPTSVMNNTLISLMGWLSASNTDAFKFTVESIAFPTVAGSASSTTVATGRLLRPETTDTFTLPVFWQALAFTVRFPIAVPGGMVRTVEAIPEPSVVRTSSRKLATRGCTSNKMFAFGTGRLSPLNATAVIKALPPVCELTASVSVCTMMVCKSSQGSGVGVSVGVNVGGTSVGVATVRVGVCNGPLTTMVRLVAKPASGEPGAAATVKAYLPP